MNTKRGMYHKKCFACVSCKSQLHYYGAIEGPDDEVNFFFLTRSCMNGNRQVILQHVDFDV